MVQEKFIKLWRKRLGPWHDDDYRPICGNQVVGYLEENGLMISGIRSRVGVFISHDLSRVEWRVPLFWFDPERYLLEPCCRNEEHHYDGLARYADYLELSQIFKQIGLKDKLEIELDWLMTNDPKSPKNQADLETLRTFITEQLQKSPWSAAASTEVADSIIRTLISKLEEPPYVASRVKLENLVIDNC